MIQIIQKLASSTSSLHEAVDEKDKSDEKPPVSTQEPNSSSLLLQVDEGQIEAVTQALLEEILLDAVFASRIRVPHDRKEARPVSRESFSQPSKVDYSHLTTIVERLLQTLPANVVLAEPPVFSMSKNLLNMDPVLCRLAVDVLNELMVTIFDQSSNGKVLMPFKKRFSSADLKTRAMTLLQTVLSAEHIQGTNLDHLISNEIKQDNWFATGLHNEKLEVAAKLSDAIWSDLLLDVIGCLDRREFRANLEKVSNRSE